MFLRTSVFRGVGTGGVGTGAMPFLLLSMLGLSIGRHCGIMTEVSWAWRRGVVEHGEVGVCLRSYAHVGIFGKTAEMHPML